MQLYEQLLALLSGGLCQIDSNLKIISANQAFRNLVQLNDEAVLGNEICSFFDLSSQKKLRNAVNYTTLDQIPVKNLRLMMTGANNGVKLVDVSISPLTSLGNGSPGHMVLMRDVTDLERSKSAMEEVQGKYQELFENASELFFVHDFEGKFTELNRAFRRFIGTISAKTEEIKVVDLLQPGQRSSFDNYIKQIISTGEACGTIEFVTRKGQKRLVEYTNTLIKDRRGRSVGVRGAARDITQRKISEQALRHSQASLIRSQKMAHMGNWELDLNSGVMTCSEEVLNILGLPKGNSPGNMAEYLDLVHPKDRRKVRSDMDEALCCQGAVHQEHRIIRPDGKERILHTIFEGLKGPHGRAAVLSGVLQDITQRRLSEQRVRLLARAFENALDGMIITNENGVIQMVNPGFTAITGYSAQEAIGRNPSILRSNRTSAKLHKAMWESIQKTGFWQGEIFNRRKNGQTYPQWLSIRAIKNEIGKVSHYVGALHDLTELKQGEAKIAHQALHDALTGLPNRIFFNERLADAMREVSKHNGKLALLFLDLDNFKNINDSLGHAVGDKLLSATAERLLSLVRDQDTVARLGGDEFIMILKDPGSKDQATGAANRIIKAMSQPFWINEREMYITASIGITIYPDDGEDLEALVSNADMAMYQAKDVGKNTTRIFTRDLNTRIKRRMSLEESLRNAIKNEELEVYFQPKVDLRTGSMAGAEALVRWNHPDKGLIGPDEFIPLAEETGLIIPLGRWVLRNSCRTAKAWMNHGHQCMQISVNLSPKQFTQKDLPQMVGNTLSDTGLPPYALELELTENMVMQNVDEAINTMHRLSNLGIQLSLDDFGRGYSSLYYLKRFPMNELKIDRSFVDDIPSDPDNASIVNTIISMGRSLNLRVVAEGVETKEQLSFLKKNNCDQMQGYFFQAPIPALDLLRLLQRGKSLIFS
ncbi:bifunctional diguanylate cyclase/phosphodiesterase [Dethiosulfatarculus sandiegensis]|uniref:Diguanylate cyclase n=1 Tax=Dethiosulfatarculus sandiegensis TaxID=1429043 RepID=A0A0D2HNQ3_9BACT|nr:EAL domain-containing protein [Dethiosulfatarculus sandiegensis]KIX12208.1 diguanylate cyclase [Dethiosulfatarculus sandiegensis]